MKVLTVECILFSYFTQIYAINIETLRLVHVVWRHGDRSPSDPTFPSDTQNPEWSWPNGWGELTEIGMTQQYMLGSYLRKRYVDSGFLQRNYNATQIYVRSSDYNRTIMSALANLAGVYTPPVDNPWMNGINWQPIPVHSVPKNHDPVLWMDRPCPKADDVYFNDVLKSEAAQRVENEFADLLTFLRNKTGHPISSLDDVRFIYDPLNCERIHNSTHQWPDWMNTGLFYEIEQLYKASKTFIYHDPRLQRFRGSLLFSEIAERNEMKSKKDKRLKPSTLKYYAYSAHDGTIIALLENLGAYDGQPPEYATAIIFELHERSGKYFVEVLYINKTASEFPAPISVKECESSGVCSLEKFVDMARRQTPLDWYGECGYSKHSRAEVASYILAITTALFFFLFIISFAFILRYRSSGILSIRISFIVMYGII